MLYIGCQYQAIKKLKKKESRPTLPYLSFLQVEMGNTHIFFFGLMLFEAEQAVQMYLCQWLHPMTAQCFN